MIKLIVSRVMFAFIGILLAIFIFFRDKLAAMGIDEYQLMGAILMVFGIRIIYQYCFKMDIFVGIGPPIKASNAELRLVALVIAMVLLVYGGYLLANQWGQSR